MSSETKRKLMERSLVVVECFAVLLVYVGVVAMLLHPALDAAYLMG